MDGVIRIMMWAGRMGPGSAVAGGRVTAPGVDAERVRRAVLACGVALATDRLAAAAPARREPVTSAFGASRPDDLVDLTGRCVIGGLRVAPQDDSGPPSGAAIAHLVVAPGDDPDDAEPVIIPGNLVPEEAAALAAACLARALPRDPMHLARCGVALRAIAREATLYPETLPDMAAGIAATARDPEDVRLFTEGSAVADADERRSMRSPGGRRLAIGSAITLVLCATGVGVAALLVRVFDPGGANPATALVAGAIIGGVAGVLIVLGLARR